MRVWVTVVLALGVAFWLQLDGASSAGVCVVILAFQTSGQALEKAAYRTLGTLAGGIAAIVLTDLFVQARDLMVLTCSAWLGLCVFVAGLMDGNRAYGAVLSGYTVSIVAIERIDMPDQVFPATVNRVAAILVGIVAVGCVNAVVGVRPLTPDLLRRVRETQTRVREFSAKAMRPGSGQGSSDAEAAMLLGTVVGWHPEIAVPAAEGLAGVSRAASIRTTATALVGEIFAARRLRVLQAAQAADDPLDDLMLRRQSFDVESCRAATAAPVRRMPVYRPWQNALRNSGRAFLVSVASGCGFILTGWPQTGFAWGVVGIVVSLSATAVDPRIIARAALIAFPASVVLGGVTLFVFLDGSDALPLLCLGLLPPVIGAALLQSSPKPEHAVIGSLTGLFTLVMISASNPQSYDPATYCINGLLLILAAIIVYVLVLTLFPAGEAARRGWVLGAARQAARTALHGRSRRPAAEAGVLDASRIAALPVRGAADLAWLFWLADLSAAARRAWQGLDRLVAEDGAAPALAPLCAMIRTGLLQADATVLRRAARSLVARGTALSCTVGADLALAARLIDRAPAEAKRTVFGR